VITVVLDTNVLDSGVTGYSIEKSVPGAILRAWVRGTFSVVLSDHILTEVATTLDKPYFRRRLSPDRASRLQLLFRERASSIPVAGPVERIASHPEDDLVLATADSGKADYLVTGDQQLRKLGQFKGVTIVSPRAFLEILIQKDEAGSARS